MTYQYMDGCDYCDFSKAMISWVGRTSFTRVSVCDSLVLSNISIPT